MPASVEGLQAEVAQVIKDLYFDSFLTPNVASKNDARGVITLISARIT